MQSDEDWQLDEILVGVSMLIIGIGYALFTIAVTLEGMIGGEE